MIHLANPSSPWFQNLILQDIPVKSDADVVDSVSERRHTREKWRKEAWLEKRCNP
jgi:ABC-type Fe3+ transport system substrate-binding protein